MGVVPDARPQAPLREGVFAIPTTDYLILAGQIQVKTRPKRV